MNKVMQFLLVSAALCVVVTPTVQAEEKHHMHASHEAPAAAQTHPGQGTINKIDPATGKANITHGPIKSLGWSGMTMDFQVSDKEGLAALKPGQKVEFEIEKSAAGKYVITGIRPAKP